MQRLQQTDQQLGTHFEWIEPNSVEKLCPLSENLVACYYLDTDLKHHSIKIYNTAENKEYTLQEPGAISCMAKISPFELAFSGAHYGLQIWDSRTERSKVIDRCRVDHLAFIPDLNLLAGVLSDSSKILRTWNLTTNRSFPFIRRDHNQRINIPTKILSWQRYILTGHSNGTIYTWDPGLGECKGMLTHQEKLSPSAHVLDNLLITHSCIQKPSDHSVTVIDLQTETKITRSMKEKTNCVLLLPFHLFLSGHDSCIQLWSLYSQEPLRTLSMPSSCHSMSVLSDPLGFKLFCGTANGVVRFDRSEILDKELEKYISDNATHNLMNYAGKICAFPKPLWKKTLEYLGSTYYPTFFSMPVEKIVGQVVTLENRTTIAPHLS